MKYEPLEHHLHRQQADSVALTFEEIERIIDAKLPPSARKHQAWWANNATNHVNALAWLNAGFRAEDVDVPGGRLVFRRARAAQARRAARHPLFGTLKGTVKVMPGVDLTEPADPEWGKAYE